MDRYDITIQMLGVEASGPQYVWEKVPAEEGELVLYTDAQATIAALQAALDSERAQSLRHVEEAMNLRAQLTQRTVELEAANKRVMDERNLSNSWMKKHDELLAKVHKSGQFGAVVVQDVLKERDTLQAELERVRGELAETKEEVTCLDEQVSALNQGCLEYERLILALPKVEGEINERFCTGSYYSSPHDYRSHVTFETALVALLKHRQGMEG